MPQSIEPELKDLGPHSSVQPQGKAANHFSLLSLRTLFTWPVTKCFFLRHLTPLLSLKLCRLLQCTLQCESPNRADSCTDAPRGRKRGSHRGCTYQAPARRVVTWIEPLCVVYGNPKLKAPFWARWWQPAFLLQCLGHLLHSGAPVLFCDPRDPETTLFHLGSCSTSPPEHLSGRDVSHWSRLVKVLVLRFGAVSLSSSWLMEASSPWFIFQYITSDSLLCKKVVTFLFVELQQFFSMITGWVHRCSEWFDSYLAKFKGQDETRAPYSSTILLPISPTDFLIESKEFLPLY